MKFLILSFCVACAAAASIEQEAKVIRSDYSQSPEGGYQYAFETDNGIAGQASGVLKQVGKDEGSALVVTGTNQHKSPEGVVFQLSYIADENGYQPKGDHLPTPPPTEALPEHVVRSLAYIATHPYVEAKKL